MKITKTIMIFMLVMLIFVVSACSQQEIKEGQTSLQNINGMSCAEEICGSQSAKLDVEKVEVYHFHGNNQCVSCIAVGDLAEETINTYFANELKSGKIVFAHINAELAENAQLAKKYGVSGSSLWIGVYTKDGQFKAEENVNVWYKIRDKAGYMSYLKGVIDKKLDGDLS
jgi:hypothetical protein